MLVNLFILNRFMSSADEHSCYFFAECIKSGKLWATPHPLSEFFDVVHIGNKDGKWFSVYPPGWPALFALGLKFKLIDWLNPALATVAVVLLYRTGKKIFSFSSTCLGIILLTTTPFFLFNNAGYFSHTTCLLMISLFLFAYMKWQRRKSTFWAVLAGFAVGYGLLTRYLTMAAIAVPFIAYEFSLLILRKSRFNRNYVAFGFVLFLMVWINLSFNHAITGHFFNPPNHYHHRWERLGFQYDYTPFDAFMFIVARLFYLSDWIAPGMLVIYVISFLKKRKEDGKQFLFRFGFLFLVFGYIFYYSWGGNQYGPRYYFEGLPFLAMTAAASVIDWWRNGNSDFKKFLLGIIFVCFVGNVYLLAKQAAFFSRASAQRKDLYALAEKTVRKPAIVFIRGFLGDALVMSEEDAIRNSPWLDGSILYVRNLGAKNDLLKKYYPDREYYLGFYDRAHKKAQLEPLPK